MTWEHESHKIHFLKYFHTSNEVLALDTTNPGRKHIQFYSRIQISQFLCHLLIGNISKVQFYSFHFKLISLFSKTVLFENSFNFTFLKKSMPKRSPQINELPFPSIRHLSRLFTDLLCPMCYKHKIPALFSQSYMKCFCYFPPLLCLSFLNSELHCVILQLLF